MKDLARVQIDYLDENIMPLNEEALNWRPHKYRWNIYEVTEHLNRFGVFYLPKMRDVIDYPRSAKKSDFYKSSFFGEFAFKRIRPVDGVVTNKAKTLSKNNPFLRVLDRSVLEEHKEQLEKFIDLCHQAEDVNLSKNALPTMLSKYVKLNLGDSMRIMIYHSERHYIQLDNLVHQRMDA